MHYIKLNYVLCVPKLTQNLLSILRIFSQITIDDLLLMHFFFFLDSGQGHMGDSLKRLCIGLYLIPSLAHTSSEFSQSSPQDKAFLRQLVQYSVWHNRLEHPSNHIVSLMLNKAMYIMQRLL